MYYPCCLSVWYFVWQDVKFLYVDFMVANAESSFKVTCTVNKTYWLDPKRRYIYWVI